MIQKNNNNPSSIYKYYFTITYLVPCMANLLASLSERTQKDPQKVNPSFNLAPCQMKTWVKANLWGKGGHQNVAEQREERPQQRAAEGSLMVNWPAAVWTVTENKFHIWPQNSSNILSPSVSISEILYLVQIVLHKSKANASWWYKSNDKL